MIAEQSGGRKVAVLLPPTDGVELECQQWTLKKMMISRTFWDYRNAQYLSTGNVTRLTVELTFKFLFSFN